MRVTFTCGTVVSDPTLIKQLLRLGDLTDLLNTSGMMALDPSGVKTLTKKDVDDDRSEYIADGLESLMQRRHVSVLRRVRTGPTNTGFNTNRNTYRPSAGEQ